MTGRQSQGSQELAQGSQELARLLVTRPRLDAVSLERAAERAGWAVALSPVIDIDFARPDNDPALGPRGLGAFGALAFTSANGVRAFARLTDERDLMCYAVGPRTADAAHEAGFAAVRIADGDVDALTALIARDHDRASGDILHPAGADRAGDLVAGLNAAGISARRVVLYQAAPVAALSAEGRAMLAAATATAPLFVIAYSPRSASLFLEQVQRAGLERHLQQAIALSVSSAVDARFAGTHWARRLIAADTAVDSVMETIRCYLRDRQNRDRG